MARKKPNPIIEGLEITDIAAEGKAIGRHGEMVVFVPLAVPGDVVDVQVTKKRKKYMEGHVIAYTTLSPLRTEAPCAHFGVCGGCKWQNLPYERQLEFKHRQVADQLTRIGHIELPEIEPVVASEETYFYRNKLEFTFSAKRWMTRQEIETGEDAGERRALGFHIPGMFDKVLAIDKCWLQPDPSNDIRTAIRDFCLAGDYSFYDARTHQGLMRNIIVRTSSTGEVMLIVVFAYRDGEKISALMEHISASFPSITSLMYVVNEKLNDSISDQTLELWAGRDHIFEQMEGLRFKIGGKSFYQTNSAQAYRLYSIAREFAELKPDDIVYDLYTGTGTIANFVARSCGRVIGVEYVPEAIEDARVNSQLNGIDNAVFYAGDMKDVLSDAFIEENGQPDVVILDPPRAGIHADVAATILRAAPERIVYVSCNPASQARDLALFDQTYRVERVRPVDMFPHTHHVENVVKLVRRMP